jgi:hypothetical protein
VYYYYIRVITKDFPGLSFFFPNYSRSCGPFVLFFFFSILYCIFFFISPVFELWEPAWECQMRNPITHTEPRQYLRYRGLVILSHLMTFPFRWVLNSSRIGNWIHNRSDRENEEGRHHFFPRCLLFAVPSKLLLWRHTTKKNSTAGVDVLLDATSPPPLAKPQKDYSEKSESCFRKKLQIIR